MTQNAINKSTIKTCRKALMSFFVISFLMLGVLSHAQADEIIWGQKKFWVFGWTPQHWEDPGYKSYMHDPKHHHPSAWQHEGGWDPSTWTDPNYKLNKTIYRLFTNGVFRSRGSDGDVPVLVVGPNFYKVSGQDQYRFVKLIDDHHRILSRGNKAIILRDWVTQRDIGSYTKYGMDYY